MPPRIHVPNPLGQAGAREVRIHAGRPARALDVVPVRAGPDVLGLLAVSVDEKTVDSAGRPPGPAPAAPPVPPWALARRGAGPGAGRPLRAHGGKGPAPPPL